MTVINTKYEQSNVQNFVRQKGYPDSRGISNKIRSDIGIENFLTGRDHL